mgnify:CR=1 FL=1
MEVGPVVEELDFDVVAAAVPGVRYVQRLMDVPDEVVKRLAEPGDTALPGKALLVLVDTSVWVAFFRRTDSVVERNLDELIDADLSPSRLRFALS